MGKSHCGYSRQTVFKRRKSPQDVLCRRYYADRAVASFPHKIKSDYHGGNLSLSIEGISLEHFSELSKSGINLFTKPCPHHAVFHSFLSGDIKQGASTTNVHSKHLIGMLIEKY